MRFAVLIIGLLIGLMLTLQSFTVSAFSESIFVDEATANAGAVGMLMALLWLVACGLIFAAPLASTVLFALSVPLGLFVPAGDFGDLRFHGFVAVVLTGMAWAALRGKRRADAERIQERAWQQERDRRLETLLVQQHVLADRQLAAHGVRSTATALDAFACPTCGRMGRQDERFCAGCGSRTVRTQPTPVTLPARARTAAI